MASDLYVRPTDGREHFLWHDFYPLLNHSDLFTKWLKEGFERYGFTPPIAIGEFKSLQDTDEAKETAARKNFSKYWDRARSVALSLGWKVESGSFFQLYLKHNPKSQADLIIITPCDSSYRFWIRIRPRVQRFLDSVRQAVNRATELTSVPAEPETVVVRQASGTTQLVQVTSSLRHILGDDFDSQTAPEVIAQRLCDFVEAFLKAIPSAQLGAH